MDDDLSAIRARRLAEMKAASGGGSSSGGMQLPPGFRASTSSGNPEEDEKRSQQEEMRRSMLSQILDPEARERLGRVAIAKPEKAQAVESHLINLARSGQLRTKLSEKELISLLESMGGNEEKKIVFNRRKTAVDSDDELELDL